MLTSLAGYLVTVGTALLWVFFSKQARVPRTRRTTICLSLRTLPLFVLFLLGCQFFAVNAIIAFAVLGVFLLIALTGSPWGIEPLSLGVLGLLYVVQQWILGWPDRSDFVLAPPAPSEDKGARLNALIGACGIASCPLRPGGMVALGKDKYPAHSDLGYIERGTAVRVVGRKGTSLLVRPAEAELDDAERASGESPGR